MEFIVNLTEDDDGEATLNLYDEDGPASTSQERLDAFGEAVWAVYDLRQLWRSIGPPRGGRGQGRAAWPQRPLQLRQRQEVQEVLRRVTEK